MDYVDSISQLQRLPIPKLDLERPTMFLEVVEETRKLTAR
jgi:hypothetical protein